MSLFWNNFETVKRLIEEKKNNVGINSDEFIKFISVRNSFGDTLFHIHYEFQIIEYLINIAKEVFKDSNGELDHLKLSNFIFAKTRNGFSPLHYQKEFLSIKLLITTVKELFKTDNKKFVDNYINARTELDNTPIYYQADDEIIELLLDYGANVTIKNWLNLTPLNCSNTLKVYLKWLKKVENVKVIQKWFKLNFKFFVFKRWVKLREINEWLFSPKVGGKYIQRKIMLSLDNMH